MSDHQDKLAIEALALPVAVRLEKKAKAHFLSIFVIAQCCQALHYACMSVQITIRDVPEEVRDELASRAALQRKSMQEYLRGELERIASRPSLENWLRSVRERKEASGTRVRAATIVSARDADRR